jgi:ribose 5-phosphate isomerase A
MFTGVVEVGLFCHMAKAAYFGLEDGEVLARWHDGRSQTMGNTYGQKIYLESIFTP